MPQIITPEALHNPEHPPLDAMWNAIENLASEYIVHHRVLPRFLYVNKRLWEEIGEDLLKRMLPLGLVPVPHEAMPYNRISLHHDYHDPARIGRWHQRFTDDEGEAGGQLNIV